MRPNRLTFITLSLCCLGSLGCAATSPPVVRPLPDTPRAVSELKRGGADAVVGDYAAMAYTARESMGVLEVVGEQFEKGNYGIAVGKSAPQLKTAVTAALRKVMQQPTYLDILRNWAIHVGKIAPPPDPGAAPAAAEILQTKDGILHVGIEMSFPPMEFKDALGKASGADVELAEAIAKEMGLTLELVNMEFDALIKAVESGQVDIAMSAITITPERSAAVDFIPYMQSGSGILVVKGNPQNIHRPSDLCDKTVAVQQGTSQIKTLENVTCY